MSRRALGAAFVLAAASCGAPYADRIPYRPPAAERAAEAARAESSGEAAPPSPLPEAPLGLEQCVSTAIENNRRVAIRDRRILIERDRADEAFRRILPRVSGDLRGTFRNNDVGFRFDERSGVTGDKDVGTASVDLIVPIYDFGGVGNAEAAALHGAAAAEFDALRERQDLRRDVGLAYYRVLETRKIAGVVEESLSLVLRQLATSTDFHEEGLVARNDVLAVEVEAAERRQDLLRANRNIDLAVATLNRLMGVDVTARTRVVDVFETPPWEGTFEKTLLAALDQRPDLDSLEEQIRRAQAEYLSDQATGLRPKLYAFGSYERSTDDFLLNQEWLEGGIALEIPIFDGGVTYARLAREKKEIAELIDLRDDRVDDVVLELKRTFLAQKDAADRVPVARRSIELAEENLRIVRDQYAEGLLTSSDVLEEEERLARARSNYYRALYEYHMAFALLEHAAGGPLSEDGRP